MKQRIQYLDSLRGGAILLVILGHCLQTGDWYNDYVWNLIYSFHMALFMAVSGFVSYRESLVWTTIKKRALELLLPFFSWSLAVAFVLGNGISTFIKMLRYPDSSLWFLWVLFFIILLTHVSCWLAKILRVKQELVTLFVAIALSLSMVLFEIRIFGYQFIAFHFLFYSLGFYMRKYQERLFVTKLPFLVVVGLLWFGGASFYRMHDLPFFLEGIPLPSSLMVYAYRFVVAALAIVFMLPLSSLLLEKKNAINSILAYLGKISLGLYAVHLTFLHFAGSVYEYLFKSEAAGTTYACIMFPALTVFSVLVVVALQRIPILSLLLLGKKK